MKKTTGKKASAKKASRGRKNGPGPAKRPRLETANETQGAIGHADRADLPPEGQQIQTQETQGGGRVTTRSRKRAAAAADVAAGTSSDPSPGPSSSKRGRVSLEQQQQHGDEARCTRSRGESSQRLLTPGERLENEVNELLCTFGDCDPEHVRTKLELLTADPNRVDMVYQDLVGGGYPTLKERLQRQYTEQQEAELLREPSIELLIKRYSDTEGLLQQSRKRTADGRHAVYKKQALSYLSNRCLHLPVPYIKRVIDKHPDVTAAYNQLKAEEDRRQQRPRASGRRGTYLLKPRTEPLAAPEETCLEFTWDSLYIEKQHDIQEYKERQEASKTLRYMRAKSLGALEECGVCVDTYLQEDMLACPSGHHYCTSCVHLSVKEQVCQGLSLFPCLHLECVHHYDLHVLSQALPPSLYRTVEARVQQEEIRRAAVPGLASCPSCSYAVVYPEEDRGAVLQCENPHCLATTCRFCQDKAHPPFTCEQRASAKTKLRQHVENKMAEAIIRVCFKCERRFVKAGGCNRMVCPNCNSVMCYVCGKQLETGYAHYNNENERCRILDETLVHEQDVTRVIPTAEQEFKETHKEAKDLTLGYDPLEDWKSAPTPAAIPPRAFGAFGAF